MPKCIDCGKEKSPTSKAKRCPSCAKKGKNHPMYGKRQSEEWKRKRSASLKGRSHGYKFEKGNTVAWKGGSMWWYHRKAREIMGIADPKLVVHHIDGDISNNKISNLMVLTRSDHIKLHLLQKGECMEDTKKKISLSMKEVWKKRKSETFK